MASIGEEIAKEQFDALKKMAIGIAKQVYKSLMGMERMDAQQRQAELRNLQKLLDAYAKHLEKSQSRQKPGERPGMKAGQNQKKPRQPVASRTPVPARESVLKKLEHSKQVVAQRDRDASRASQKAIKAPSRDLVR